MLKRAIELQVAGAGFTFVEILTMCPTGWFIETADSYLDPETCLLVREIWPDFKDQQGPVTVSLSARRHPQDVEQVVTAPAMAVGDAKADILVSGRLFKVRFAGSSAPTGCRIGQPVFDATPAGQR